MQHAEEGMADIDGRHGHVALGLTAPGGRPGPDQLRRAIPFPGYWGCWSCLGEHEHEDDATPHVHAPEWAGIPEGDPHTEMGG